MTTRLWTTAEAAAELDVPAQAIYEWKARGRVFPVDSMRGPGRNGQVPLWALEDLQPLAKKYRRTLARRAERASG